MPINLTAEDREIIIQVGLRVKNLRNNLGISQDELALRADTTKSQVFRIEHGEINCTLATLGRFAKALGVNIKELFEYD
ncbi:helix-turn-helix domain-containing protein [Flagellimonas onchidii]|uniref:helix-turn-helix domain-containing protein n=1 Tax=Flagellimonas onchidii TaxID=2562684 RepID=UPI0010A609C4|nr:helix-turn-helix transcriptional regulator [Allomuricauda onchidii]